MVTVKIEYPGAVYHYTCDRVAAEFLVAQFKGQEWITATITNGIV